MRWRASSRPAASTGSPASLGRDRDDQMRRLGQRRPTAPATCRRRRRRSGSMPALRAAARICPASASCRRSRCARPATSCGKGRAGIAGAEDEEACVMHALRRGIGMRRVAPFHSTRTSRPFPSHVLRRAAPRTRPAGSSRDSAQTAAPRTSGEASASSARQASTSDGIAGIAGGDQHVAQEAVAADALDRRAREQRAEGGIVERQQVGERRLAQIVARRRASPRDAALRELVPRADGKAVVAAIDAVADRRAELERDRPLVLDGEVGDAAPRIEPVGRREGVGRADVEAGAAGAAMVVLRRVGREFGGGEDRCRGTARSRIRG